METFLLKRLLEEVTTDRNQYGGIKGSGTNHFLINTYHHIMTALEDNKNAVSLVSVDFSKAFNRMDHGLCLKSFAYKGASQEAMTMIAAFLYNRTMRVKVGTAFSTPRSVNGGSPQGTKLGNFLFTMTIDCIEQANHPLFGSVGLPTYEDSAEDEQSEVGFTTSTPCKAGTWDGVLRYHDTSGRGDSTYGQDELINPDRAADDDRDFWCEKFVDDVNGGQSHPILEGVAHITEGKECRRIHADKCQDLYETIERNANNVKMSVNPKKTKLLCISSALNYNVSSYINISGGVLESEEKLKILGYTFGKKPNAEEHIKQIRTDYATKAWAIRNLKRAKIRNQSLVIIYCSLLRSTIEYAAPVYAHFLTSEQSNALERLQSQTLKTIFGFDKSYNECLSFSGLDTLESRRTKLVQKFAIKTSANPLWAHWFPQHEEYSYDLRKKLRYREDFAAKDRLRLSPIFTMRRLLNEL